MESLHQLEIIILLLYAVVLALTTIAQKISILYPIFWVLGGLLFGVGAWLADGDASSGPRVSGVSPRFSGRLPVFTSLREFRPNLRPISLLAVRLVLATTAGVAAVAHPVTRYGLGGNHCAGVHHLATGCRVGHRCRKTPADSTSCRHHSGRKSLVNGLRPLWCCTGLPLARW